MIHFHVELTCCDHDEKGVKFSYISYHQVITNLPDFG